MGPSILIKSVAGVRDLSLSAPLVMAGISVPVWRDVVGDDEFGVVVRGGGRGAWIEERGRLGAGVDGADELLVRQAE